MVFRMNFLIYDALELNSKQFFIRVYGLAWLWALIFVFLDYFLLNGFGNTLLDTSDDEIFSALFFILIDAPFTETLIFQCFIQTILRHAQGSPTFSILGSATIFSLCHLGNSTINAIIVLATGLALALTYEYVRMRYGNIYACLSVFISHMLWNVISAVVMPLLFIIFDLK
ncbi:CAAX amino terminal protease self-immunity [Vibrio atlanticus]|uniref:CAAX amino terminal protease self-immunity n=2 Tax=Vibrio atlanticus TaxID=693153 RepID=A0A1C3INY3_9VIBR|nr:CAAX amino terminal protease self-immunity [Vibrio atlanticus]